MVTSDPGPTSLRLFVTDRDSKIRFLVDIGADLCVFPRIMVRGPREKSTYELCAANGTTIATDGIITLTLNLGLRRAYTWRLVIADVSKPIIGVDFLAHYELLVDVRNHRLLDALTLLTVRGRVTECGAPSIKTVSGTSLYHKLLQTFPEAKILGYLVSAEGTQPLTDKVQVIRSYPRPQTAKQLRQFLGMLNFYRRFISKAAQLQTPLNDLLQGNIKGKTPVNWNPEAQVAFEHCKEGLAQAALLAHPESDATLVRVYDASDFKVGAALHQQINGSWEPLGVFLKKLSLTDKKYGAYDRELLAIYLAVKYFRHMAEARKFTIFTDHKSITFAFRQKPDKCTPRQLFYLDFIGQFTTDIRHISGKDNVVADALSRVEELAASIDFAALAASQQSDKELKTYLREGSLLQLRQMRIPETNVTVFRDVSTSITRPIVTAPFRQAAFNTVHQLSHPGIKATIKLAMQRYVWPAIKNDLRRWARTCIECQKSKVSRHVSAPQFVHAALSKVRTRAHRHRDFASLGGLQILSYVCRPLHEMARSVPFGKSRSRHRRTCFLRGLDHTVRHAASSYHGPRKAI